MVLRIPDLTSPPALLCDWVELKVLSTQNGTYRLSQLRRLWDVGRATESSDPSGRDLDELDTDSEGVSGQDEERFVDSVADEFAKRTRVLEGSYPFEIDDLNKVSVVRRPTLGNYMYIFCLLLTHTTSIRMLSGKWLPKVDNRVRDLFQACSTVAAAGHTYGNAISFGWPRPNRNPPFLTKLKEVYRIFGEGTVVDRPRRGISPFVKDEEIDVISWRPTRDDSPGTYYLLGQVASGGNWESKSIAGEPINSFHRNWFQPPPPSTPNPSIFIPQVISTINHLGDRRDRLDVLVARYGIVIDRLRLPKLVDDGIALSAREGNLIIERLADLDHIGHWVNSQILELQRRATT